MAYPRWQYYPPDAEAPEWVAQFVAVVSATQEHIDSTRVEGLSSDSVLQHLAPGLTALGYQVETGKRSEQKIKRPVLFEENGIARESYEIDAFHDALGIAVEVEAGRGAQSNAVFRDLVRTSLIVGAQHLVLGVMNEYRHQSGGRPVTAKSFDAAKAVLDAIYASGRLKLPFKGVLLFGY